MLLLPLGASAAIGDNFNYAGLLFIITNESPKECELCGIYDHTALNGWPNLVIPDEAAGYAVTSIAKKAFYDYRYMPHGMESVIIGNNIRIIHDEAFQYCFNLKEVKDWGHSLTEIGVGAFRNVESLNQIASFPGTLTSIGEYAFSDCTSLESIDFGESNPTMGERAFFFCESLETVKLGTQLKNLGMWAFSNCSKLKTINLENCESIGGFAFEGCSSLISVDLTSAVNIETGAFQFSSLKDVKFGDSIENIGPIAFNETLISSISLPPSLKSIGSNAIVSSNLTDIRIEDSETELTVSYQSIRPESDYSLYLGRKLRVEDQDRIDNMWASRNLCSLTIGNNMTEIPDGLFNHFNGIKELKLGTRVEKIGKSAFGGCGIQTLELSNSIKEIGNQAFSGCEVLSDIKMSSSLETIGESAFSGCKALKSFLSSPALREIGDDAFAGCVNIEEAVFGPKVTQIGKRAFEGSNDMKKVTATSQVPPKAYNSTFSTYNYPLYVEESALQAYQSSEYCWNLFKQHSLVSPTAIEISGEPLSYEPGKSIQLTATISPSNVSLPEIFWESTNPSVATVDYNGLVTFHEASDNVISDRPLSNSIECEIKAYTLYADAPIASVKVDDPTSVETIPEEWLPSHENRLSNNIYNIHGMLIKANATAEDVKALPRGIYIRGGKKIVR